MKEGDSSICDEVAREIEALCCPRVSRPKERGGPALEDDNEHIECGKE